MINKSGIRDLMRAVQVTSQPTPLSTKLNLADIAASHVDDPTRELVVVAVGTTATRALESAATIDGLVHAADGWTDLVLGRIGRCAWSTAWLPVGHDAGASYLLLLEAVAVPDLVTTACQEAVEHGYLWHEFGDARSYCRNSELVSRAFMNHVLFGCAPDFSESELPSG